MTKTDHKLKFDIRIPGVGITSDAIRIGKKYPLNVWNNRGECTIVNTRQDGADVVVTFETDYSIMVDIVKGDMPGSLMASTSISFGGDKNEKI